MRNKLKIQLSSITLIKKEINQKGNLNEAVSSELLQFSARCQVRLPDAVVVGPLCSISTGLVTDTLPIAVYLFLGRGHQ